MDHSEGSLAFRVNDGPVLKALRGFPKGAPLRPWARPYEAGDCVRFAQMYV